MGDLFYRQLQAHANFDVVLLAQLVELDDGLVLLGKLLLFFLDVLEGVDLLHIYV